MNFHMRIFKIYVQKVFEHIQKLDALKIEARIFRISNNMLTIKYQLEKSFIDKYHNKNIKNSLN